MSDRQHNGSAPSIEHVWDALGELYASPVVADARAYADARHETLERQRLSRMRLFKFGFVGLAATTACVALLVIAGPLDFFQPTVLTTGVGEIRKERLADGSAVILDTDTRIEVKLGSNERQLTLRSGQAHFDVAHDPQRPFTVSFGRGAVTAIGTSFDVSALPSTNSVTLLSGKVVVTADPGSADKAIKLKLEPGQRVSVTKEGKLTSPITVDPISASAWQHGRIDLSDLTLDEALARVNRYSTTKIVVNDEALSDRRISGIFQAGDTNAVTEALCAYFDLSVLKRSERTIVLGRKPA